jgi:hypothetical protein
MFRAGNKERSPEERAAKVGACCATESELASTRESMAWNAQALACSLERNRVLEEELSQL